MEIRNKQYSQYVYSVLHLSGVGIRFHCIYGCNLNAKYLLARTDFARFSKCNDCLNMVWTILYLLSVYD